MPAHEGAKVNKIEQPCVGDEAPKYGPFPTDDPHPERRGRFLYLSANKLGITMNLGSGTGKIFKELIKETDAWVENGPPELMEELGLDCSDHGFKPLPG